MKSRTDGYYKCILVNSSADSTFRISLSDSPTPGTANPSFPGANLTYLVCHVFWLNSAYTVAPIVTAGAPVTKAADSLTDVAWPVTSSAVVDVTVDEPITSTMNMLGFGAAAASRFEVDGASSARLINVGIDASITPASTYEGERHSFGMSLQTNDGVIVDDENNDDTDATGTPGQGTIFIGSASDLTGQPCRLHRVQVSNQTFTAEDLKPFL